LVTEQAPLPSGAIVSLDGFRPQLRLEKAGSSTGNLPGCPESGCEILGLSAAPENGIVSSPGKPSLFPGTTEPEVRVRVPRKNNKPRKPGNIRRSDMWLRLELQSNPEALCLVRATLERATEFMRFQEPASRAIVRSVDEAVANVIRHAYKGRTGMPITLTFKRLWCGEKVEPPAGLEILLQDSGEAADPKKLRGRRLDEVRPGGLGLHFMRQSMDKVEFSRKNGKNLLRMVKYLEPYQNKGEKENRPCR
jgi:serine/threonine-protein kinase RsbW